MFISGQSVTYQGMKGFINFIDEEYVTICLSSKPNPDGRGSNQCCICVYPNQQDSIIIDDNK